MTDTGCDLDKALREKYDIEYVSMHFSCEGKSYEIDLDWEMMPAKDFYNAMREGKRFISAQVNVEQYKAAFERFVQAGYDVLSISTSSEISASGQSKRGRIENVVICGFGEGSRNAYRIRRRGRRLGCRSGYDRTFLLWEGSNGK